MTRRRALPPGLGRAFAVSAARASGVPMRRLDAHDLEARFWGARMLVPQASPTPQLDYFERRHREFLQLCAAYLPLLPTGGGFSHATAARLYGMPLPDRAFTNDLDVVAPEPPRRRGVVGRNWTPIEVVTVAGMPAVAPAVAWLQLGAHLTRDELVVAGDYLLRRKHPLCTREAIAALLMASIGRRGVATARSAFGLIRSGTDSPPESWMRIAIGNAGFPEPIIGFEVTHEGYFVGTPDLAYPELKIAFEYQGAGHRSREDFESDIARLEMFHEAGWIVIQVTAGLLATPGWLAERTRRARIERGA